MSHAYRAPTATGAVLAEPDFDALPALVEANRRLLARADVTVGGLSLRELRALARREVLELAASLPSPLAGEGGSAKRSAAEPGEGSRHDVRSDVHPSPAPGEAPGLPSPARGEGKDKGGPLILAGHQPELSHPGVWVKNFALNGLARKLGGVPLHLVVDNDTLKSTSLRLPTFRAGDPASARLESIAFDTFSGEVPYEDRTVYDEELFRSVWDRTRHLGHDWGYEPLLRWTWLDVTYQRGTIGDRFTATRRRFEQECGCHNLELPVSKLSQTEAFARFASHILADLPRFRAVYNAAIRAYREANGVRSANHPAPELADGEAPFWVRSANGRRARATATSGTHALRPRALTLTLFARVCLGDFFIHGIGGGKYDEVTDAIIRDYFGIEPPAYQVLSATLHLPLPAFPASANDQTRAERRLRDLRWNPHHCLSAEQLAEANVRVLLAAHAACAEHEPPYANHAERKEWFRALQLIKEQLRALVAEQIPAAEAELRRVRSEVGANAILQRRDYAWVLYPEETLRPFLTSFMG